MERHPCEAIINNVFGTKNVLAAAADSRVERFVFISSDKAVNPVNVMGATKRIGELLIQEAAQTNGMRAACVRFGNVLGSRGSVLPLFQRQIAEGGPVTITHPEMTRYFMTIQEAVQLDRMRRHARASAGEVFVLDMGRPRNILDLAREMILLSGLEPEKDIVTSITGLRPGEKLMEELVSSSEILGKTQFDKLSVIEPPMSPDADAVRVLGAHLSRLVEAARRNEPYAIPTILSEMGLGFTPQPAKARSAAAAANSNFSPSIESVSACVALWGVTAGGFASFKRLRLCLNQPLLSLARLRILAVKVRTLTRHLPSTSSLTPLAVYAFVDARHTPT